MKIIYTYKGTTTYSNLSLDSDIVRLEPNEGLEGPYNRNFLILLLGKEDGSFLEYSGAFSVVAPFPDGIIVAPEPQEFLEVRPITSEIRPTFLGNSFEVGSGFPDYSEVYDISGLNSSGFAKLRIPVFSGVIVNPEINTRNLVAFNESVDESPTFIEGTELVDFELKTYLESLDPRIKAENVIVTPVRNTITLLPDNSNPESEHNIYKYFKEDPVIKSCSTLRVLKPPGFGCVPTDLIVRVAEEEVSQVATLAPQEVRPTVTQSLTGPSLPPDYSFGVTAQYKINDGPWVTYQRLSTDEDTEFSNNGYERQPYDFCNWSDHVYDFFSVLQDYEGRNLFCFEMNGGNYVPFQVSTGNWNNPDWSIYGAELNFENWDNYYPPPIDFFSNNEEEPIKVDPNRQTILYFRISGDTGNLADIVKSIFGEDSEVRSCCYAYWYSQAQ